jgi:tRNA(Ile)-lysidine synthase
MLKVFTEIGKLCDAHRLNKSENYLIGVSGGSDSIGLMMAMFFQGYNIEVAHVNYGLRGAESDAEMDYVKTLCKNNEIVFHSKQFETTEISKSLNKGIQETARILRYEWFEELRQTRGLDFILVAHHKEDQAHSILLNIIRGTGILGLRGMLFQNGKIKRPFLEISKNDILEFLKTYNLEYLSDSSNDKNDYSRNLLRNEVIPLLKKINPQVEQHVLNLSKIVEQDLVQTDLPEWYKSVQKEDFGIWDIDYLFYEKNNESIFGKSLLGRLGFRWEQIQGASTNPNTGKSWIKNNVTIHKTNQGIFLEKNPSNSFQEFNWEISDSLEEIETDWGKFALTDKEPVNNLFSLPIYSQQKIIIRSREAGDTMKPEGLQGKNKKVKEILIDRKIPNFIKTRIPMVLQNETIIWIPGVKRAYPLNQSIRSWLVWIPNFPWEKFL